MSNPGIFSTITATAINGNIVATAADLASSSPVNTKVISPLALKTYLGSLPAGVGISGASGSFSALSASTISGAVVPTTISSFSANNVLITPATLSAALFNPPVVLGGGNASSSAKLGSLTVTGAFSLTGDAVQASEGGTGNSSYTAGDILVASASNALGKLTKGSAGQVLTVATGGIGGLAWSTPKVVPIATTASTGTVTLATDAAAKSMVGSAVITASNLAALFSAPPQLGNTSSRIPTAFVNVLDANSVSASSTGIAGTSDLSGKTANKIMTPSATNLMMTTYPPAIGSTTANTGKFTTLTANAVSTTSLTVTGTKPWTAEIPQLASTTEATTGTNTTKAVTPAGLKAALNAPGTIGNTGKTDTGYFKTINATNINVTNAPWTALNAQFATEQQAIDAVMPARALNPANLTGIFANPKPLGATTPNTIQGTTITATTQFVGVLGDAATKQDATVKDLKADTIDGDVIATNSEVVEKTVTNKAIAPSQVPAMMASPGPIGSATPDEVTATTVTATSLAGSVIASDANVTAGISTSTVVTPQALKNQLASPNPIGSVAPNTGSFTALKAQTVGGAAIASKTNIFNGVANDQIVTPSGLKGLLSEPYVIGATTANAGYFTNLNATSVAGDVVATSQQIIDGTDVNTIVTPAGLNTLFANVPFNIGSDTKRTNAYFDNMDANTVTGDVIATSTDVDDGTANNLIITPKTLKEAIAKIDLASPPPIGNVKPNTGDFTNLTAEIFTGQVGTDSAKNTGTFTTVTANSVTILDSTNSTDTATGALIVTGGVAVGADVVVGGKLTVELESTLKKVVAITDETSADSTTTGALTVVGGVSTQENLWVGGTTTLQKVVTITDTTSSITATDQGAFVVAGGVGVGENLNVNGNTTVYGTGFINNATSSTSTSTGAFVVSGGAAVGENLNIGGSSAFEKDVSIKDATTSDATNTGALVVVGGVGVGENVNIGGKLNVALESTLQKVVSITDDTAASGTDVAALVVTGGANITKNVIINSTDTADSTTTGALTVVGGVSTQENMWIGGTLNVAQESTLQKVVSITDTTESSEVTSGALVVSGGVGIALNTNIGGKLNVAQESTLQKVVSITDTTESTDIASGALVVSGGVGIALNTNIGGKLNVADESTLQKIVTITDDTAASGTNVGAFVLAGGANVSKNVIINSADTADSTTTGALTVVGGISTQENMWIDGTLNVAQESTLQKVVSITDTTDSSDATTGALVVSGGVGIAKDTFIGGKLNIADESTLQKVVSVTDTTSSTDIASGALIVSGGVGITENVNIGGKLNVAQESTLQKVVSITDDTAATGTDTGALVVSGGANVSKNVIISGDDTASSTTTGALTVVGGISTQENLWVGGTFNVAQESTLQKVVSITDATSSAGTDSGALVVSGGVGISENLNVGAKLNVTNETTLQNKVAVTDATSSTSTDSGAFVVTGGAGIGENLNVGGITKIVNDTASTDTESGALVVAGGTAIQGDLYLAGDFVMGGAFSLSGTDDSTDTMTGAFVVQGGVGIYKRLNVGDKIQAWSEEDSTSTDTGSLVVNGGVGIAKNANIGGVVNILDATTSSTTTSGALTVVGGVSTQENLFVGGITNLKNDTTSSDVTSGALIVDGGVGIAKDVFIGGVLNVALESTLQKVVSITDDTDSTDIASGALVVSGGVGIAKDIWVGGVTNLSNESNSISTDTGALVVAGGVGVASDMWVGGSTYSSGVTKILNENNAIDTESGALIVSGGVSITKDLVIGGDLKILGSFVNDTIGISVSDDTAASGTDVGALVVVGGANINKNIIVSGIDTADSTTTGALTVVGGVSTQENLFVGGITNLKNTAESSDVTSGALIVDGGVGIGLNAFIGGALNVAKESTLQKVVSITDATESTDVASGALVVSGGVGIALNTNIGGKLNVADESTLQKIVTVTDETAASGTNVGAFVLAGGANVAKNLIINSADTADSTTTGALTVVGGVSTQENLFVGGITNLKNTTESSDVTSGALIVDGGVGIGLNTFIGGKLNVAQESTLQKVVSITDATESTDLASGALVVSGGVGITLNTNIGGKLNVADESTLQKIVTVTDDTAASGTNVGAFVLAGGANIAKNVIISGVDTADSTTTGALTVVGGVSTQENLFVGGITNLKNIAESNDVTSGALVVDGGVGIGLNAFIGGKLNIAQESTLQKVVSITDTTESTDLVSGALVVSGGVGIALNTNIGGKLNVADESTLQKIVSITDVTESTDIASGALVVSGGVGIALNTNIGGKLDVALESTLQKVVSITDDTAASGTDTGALVVSGGANITKNVIISGADTADSTTTGALTVVGGVSTQENLFVGGITNLKNTTESSDITSGALVVDGGVGIAKDVFIGGKLNVADESTLQKVVSITDTTSSTDVASGALVVSGGVGITENVNIGGKLNVADESTLQKVVSITDVTASAGTDSGALIVSGGVGIAESLNVGSKLTVIEESTLQKVVSITDASPSADTTSGALIVSGGVGIGESLNVGSKLNVADESTLQKIVSITDTTDSSDVTSGALVVSGGVGIALNTNIGGKLNVADESTLQKIVSVTDTTSSTDVASGALIVSGGVGIAENLNVGGTMNVAQESTLQKVVSITDATPSADTTSGALIVSGGVGIGESLNVGSKLNVADETTLQKIVSVTDATSSTDTASGAFVVTGGAGIGENLNVGGITKIFNNTAATDTESGALVIVGGTAIQGDLQLGGDFVMGGAFKLAGTDESTSTDSGAFVVEGGVGVALRLNVGGKIQAWSEDDSTSTDTGSLVVNGGVGIAMGTNIGGVLNVGGASALNGATIYNTTDSGASDEGSLVVSGGVGIALNTNMGGSLTVGGKTVISEKSTATSTDSGALVVAGGVGIGRDAYIAGTETLAVTGTWTDSTTALSLTTAEFKFGTSSLDLTTASTDYLLLPDMSTYISGAWSVNMWVKLGASTADQIFLASEAPGLSVSIDKTAQQLTIKLSSDDTNNDIWEESLDLSRTAPDVSPLLPNDWNLITINYYQDAFYTDQSAYNVFINGEIVGNKFSTIPVSITTWSTLRLTNKNFASGYVDSIKISRAYGSLIAFTPETTMFAFDKDTIVLNNFDSTSASESGEFNSQLVVISSSTSTSTGGLVVGGGVGITENLFVGGYANIGESIKVGKTVDTINYIGSLMTLTTLLDVQGETVLEGALTIGGTVSGSGMADFNSEPPTDSVTETKVVSPLYVYNSFTTPPEIGSVVPNKGFFTNLKFSDMDTSSGALAIASDIVEVDATTSKLVTPGCFSDFWQSPSVVLGNTAPNDAKFLNIDGSSVSGTVIADAATDFDSVTPSNTKVITPAVLQASLKSPFVIGETTRADGYFDQLAFTTLKSDNIASQTDITTGTSDVVVVTAKTLAEQLASPVAIGSTAPNEGTFTTLTGSVYYGAIGSASDYKNAYVDTINANNVSGSVIPADMTELAAASNSQIVTPYLLMQSFNTPPTTIGDGSTNASFSEISFATVSGTGIATAAEINAGADNTKVITPQNFVEYLANSPTNIGISNPAEGNFTVLTASTSIAGVLGSDITKQNATVAVLKADSLDEDSGLLATTTDVTNATVAKLVDAKTLNEHLGAPVAIGSTTPNSGAFTALVADTMTGDVIADLATIKAGTAEDLLITPKGLTDLFNDPIPFGTSTAKNTIFGSDITGDNIYGALGSSTVANVAFVTDLSAETIAGGVVADPDSALTDFGATPVNNKIVTPSALQTYLTAPQPIGAVTPSEITGTIVEAKTNFVGILGTDVVKSDAFIANLTADTFTGDALAEYADVADVAPPANKVVPADVLSQLFAKPLEIGSDTANAAKFTDVTVTGTIYGAIGDDTTSSNGVFNDIKGVTVQGDMIADATTDFTALPIPNNRIVTPFFFDYWQKNPGVIGEDTANEIIGTNIIANTQFTGVLGDAVNKKAAVISDLTADTITGDVMAITDDLTGATPQTNKVVSPSVLVDFLTQPTEIGATKPGNATFVTLTATSLAGDAIATDADLALTTTDSKIIDYGVLKTFIQAPTVPIGSATTDATFNDLTIDTIAGAGVGTNAEHDSYLDDAVTNPAANNKVVTPELLTYVLSKPTEIGAAAPNNATFLSCTANAGFYGNVGDSTTQHDGYFDSIQANSLTLTDVTINGTFTLDSQVTPAQGGTGISTYNKGDIIAASDPSTLNKVNVGANYTQLYALDSETTGLKWGVLLPQRYLRSGNPVYQTVSQYVMPYVYARNAANTDNIIITSSRVLDLANVGVLNGIAQGDYLNGTIDTSGVTVSGTGTSFATDFIAGDVIYAGTEGRRIVSISGDSTMVLESAFATDLTGLSYKNGGLAPKTHYYIYALGDITTPGYVLSTRSTANNDTLINLPTGYSTSNVRQLTHAITTDASGNVVFAIYSDNFVNILSPQVTTTVTTTSYVAVSTNLVVPKTANTALVSLYLKNEASSTNNITLSNSLSGTFSTNHLYVSGNGEFFNTVPATLNASSKNLYMLVNKNTSGSMAKVTVQGYYVNSF